MKKKKKMNPKGIMIGYKLKQLRLSKGYTQGKLAEYLQITTQHYGTLERGQNLISMEHLFKICNFYKVPTSYIIGEITEVDKKITKEDKKMIKQISDLSNEHKEIVTEIVKLYAQLEKKQRRMQEKIKQEKAKENTKELN